MSSVIRKKQLFVYVKKGTDQLHGYPKSNQHPAVMILSFQTDRSYQTVQTQIRLLLEEQSDQGLHFLLFPLHHFDKVT